MREEIGGRGGEGRGGEGRKKGEERRGEKGGGKEGGERKLKRRKGGNIKLQKSLSLTSSSGARYPVVPPT